MAVDTLVFFIRHRSQAFPTLFLPSGSTLSSLDLFRDGVMLRQATPTLTAEGAVESDGALNRGLEEYEGWSDEA